MATNSVVLTMAYENTDFTRKYKLDNVKSSDLANVKQRVLDYNSNLPAQDKQIFVSDDFDESQDKGKLSSIIAAYYEVVEYTRINLN